MDENIVEMGNVYLDSSKGDEIFRNLNFSLKSGRTAIIIGGSGSGKTSFVEMIVGRQFAKSGSVEVFGQIIKPGRRRIVNKVRRQIGGVGGIFELIPSYTIAQNIAFPIVVIAKSKKYRHERTLKMLTEFSLINRAGDYPHDLTRVQKTLALFARASVANQPLIIIDEPSAGMDQSTSERIFKYLHEVSMSGLSMIILGSEK
ncbi:MAG: ATP-binding cassette domain-containing protein, partial [bacterium]